MQASQFGLLGTRALQSIFAVVVVAISVRLARFFTNLENLCNQFEPNADCTLSGTVPALWYCTFVGAWSLLDIVVGIVTVFVSAIPSLVTLVVSALATVFYLAGAIRLTVLFANADCTAIANENECNQSQTDTAFLWIGFVGTLVALGLTLLVRRQKSTGVSHV